ncbi:cytochrome-450 hydroxylase [Schizophyllum commune Tattone D]|nr:cytochrome-450 hydroxylase [Schizophyllum commune Tattone D]
MHTIILALLTSLLLIVFYGIFILFVRLRFSPIHQLPGPPVAGVFKSHLRALLDPAISPRVHDLMVRKYGRNIRIRGVGPWDERLLTVDPTALTHVLRNASIYQKPWQSRAFISSLIGCGILASEGQMHKRHRRVATPAFSPQNMRALVPVVFGKGEELKDRWLSIMRKDGQGNSGVFDVAHWISRATFDVFGVAGFDYNFEAIQHEDNELLNAYKDMFELAVSQGSFWQTMTTIYAPFLLRLFPTKKQRTVKRCQEVIRRVTGDIIQHKKRKIEEGVRDGKPYEAKDILTLLLKSNMSTDIPSDQRITDADLLDNINTLAFAGSDTSSLALTWTLRLLAEHPEIQARLRTELLALRPPPTTSLTADEIHSLYDVVAEQPLLHNVMREALRLIPPIHSSLRVCTRDDVVPTKYPVHDRDGNVVEGKHEFFLPKGTMVHVPIEAFNLDKEVWGEDAWEFKPQRWDDLPELAKEQPGVFPSILTFSGGTRSCIGMRFSVIEIKAVLYTLITNFVFAPTEDEVFKANVVLTRPYVAGKFKEGSQCPLRVTVYEP